MKTLSLGISHWPSLTHKPPPCHPPAGAQWRTRCKFTSRTSWPTSRLSMTGQGFMAILAFYICVCTVYAYVYVCVYIYIYIHTLCIIQLYAIIAYLGWLAFYFRGICPFIANKEEDWRSKLVTSRFLQKKHVETFTDPRQATYPQAKLAFESSFSMSIHRWLTLEVCSYGGVLRVSLLTCA
jgi:hypothetical protein